MRRSPALAIVCCAAFIVAVVWLTPPRAPTRPGAMQVVQRLERPRGMAASASRDEATLADLSSRARHRWMASAIASSRTRVASGASVTLRSPRLGLSSPDDVYAIVVGVAASAGEEGALLLWGHEPTLSRADYLRWRRDIRAPRGGASTVVVSGKDIRGDGVEPLRYLFLHLPAGRDLSRIIDFVAIVETRDIGVGTAPAGAVRLALDGHVRDVLPGLHELSYPVDVPDGAELVFGVRSSPNTTSTVRVTIARRGSEALVLEQRVNGGAWRDFRTALPAGPAALLTLQTASPTEGEPPSWLVPLLLAPEPEHDPRRPNIVLYVVDTLRADTLGLYGAATASTPTLDDLGGRGRVFRHAYTAASWTKPAIASLLTSLHPQTHGLGAHYYTDPLPDRVPTLQGMLQAEGYATAQFSGNAFAGTLSNLDRGFDWSFMPSSFGTRQGEPSPKIEGDALTARVLPWLEAHARDRFFLYVQSMDVHPPYSDAERAAGGGAPSARDQYAAAVARADREIGRCTRDWPNSGSRRERCSS